MTKQLIGFAGRIGSGKTEAAKALNAIGFMRIRFAGPLKAMARVLLTEAQVDGLEKEKPAPQLGGKTPREFMQLLGTEFGRQMIWPELWIEAFRRNAQKNASVPIVCDDVRFDNEVRLIRELEGKVFYILRPGLSLQNHISEDLRPEDCDGVIHNDKDLGIFLDTIRALRA